jgi:hypothetical protein
MLLALSLLVATMPMLVIRLLIRLLSSEPYPTWTLKDGTNLPNAPGKLLTDIVVNKLNPDMLFATYSGFDINGEMTVETMSNPQTTLQLGKVFMSTNGGDTWTNITFGAIKPAAPNSLPKNMLPDLPVLCAALYTPDASYLAFVYRHRCWRLLHQ